jgi:hypothetical protein
MVNGNPVYQPKGTVDWNLPKCRQCERRAGALDRSQATATEPSPARTGGEISRNTAAALLEHAAFRRRALRKELITGAIGPMQHAAAGGVTVRSGGLGEILIDLQ